MIVPLLAHAGAGSTWQAAVVFAAVGLALAVLFAAAGWVELAEPGDLVAPFAVAAILASLGTLGQVWLSDGIGWALPLGGVALLALLLAALTPLELTPTSPLSLGAVALAGVGIVLLYTPLTIALHPPADLLPLADDSQVMILSPEDGDRIEPGPVEVTVEVTGGSIGPPFTPLEDLGVDPEEAGALAVYVDGDRRDVTWDPTCTLAQPCERVTFEVEVPTGEPRLTVEFVRGDGTPFAPLVVDRMSLRTQ